MRYIIDTDLDLSNDEILNFVQSARMDGRHGDPSGGADDKAWRDGRDCACAMIMPEDAKAVIKSFMGCEDKLRRLGVEPMEIARNAAEYMDMRGALISALKDAAVEAVARSIEE